MSLIRLNSRRILQNFIRQRIFDNKYISTSQKKDETASISHPIEQVKTETSSSTKKDWVSYGFSYKDEAEDRNTLKASFFFSVTLCIVWGTFVWAYLPDTQMRDWAQRQAFLELRRREQIGVDLVNPNYIDPNKIQLPSDEELGDTEIII